MRAVIASAGILLVASSVLADPPAKKADVTKIVQKADEATRKCKSVTYDYRLMALEGAANPIPTMTGQAKAIMGESMETSPYWVEVDNPATDGPTGSNPMTVMGNDGINAYSMNYEQKSLIWAPIDGDGARLLSAPRRFMMIEFVHPEPFLDELNGQTLTLEGTKKIGDIECDVVRVVYADDMGEAVWYFGQADHLPHRVDRTNSGFSLELSNINGKAKLKADEFAIKAPDGFNTTEFKVPPPPPPPQLIALGAEAPDWTLKGADGQSVSLKDLRGNVVLIDFWATWCGPCKAAMPGVQKIHEHFKGKDVKVFGVSAFERKDPIDGPAKYMKDQNYTYNLLVEGTEVAKTYLVRSIPTFYVIDKDGKVAFVNVGADPKGEEHLVEIIEGLLAKGGI